MKLNLSFTAKGVMMSGRNVLIAQGGTKSADVIEFNTEVDLTPEEFKTILEENRHTASEFIKDLFDLEDDSDDESSDTESDDISDSDDECPLSRFLSKLPSAIRDLPLVGACTNWIKSHNRGDIITVEQMATACNVPIEKAEAIMKANVAYGNVVYLKQTDGTGVYIVEVNHTDSKSQDSEPTHADGFSEELFDKSLAWMRTQEKFTLPQLREACGGTLHSVTALVSAGIRQNTIKQLTFNMGEEFEFALILDKDESPQDSESSAPAEYHLDKLIGERAYRNGFTQEVKYPEQEVQPSEEESCQLQDILDAREAVDNCSFEANDSTFLAFATFLASSKSPVGNQVIVSQLRQLCDNNTYMVAGFKHLAIRENLLIKLNENDEGDVYQIQYHRVNEIVAYLNGKVSKGEPTQQEKYDAEEARRTKEVEDAKASVDSGAFNVDKAKFLKLAKFLASIQSPALEPKLVSYLANICDGNYFDVEAYKYLAIKEDMMKHHDVDDVSAYTLNHTRINDMVKYLTNQGYSDATPNTPTDEPKANPFDDIDGDCLTTYDKFVDELNNRSHNVITRDIIDIMSEVQSWPVGSKTLIELAVYEGRLVQLEPSEGDGNDIMYRIINIDVKDSQEDTAEPIPFHQWFDSIESGTEFTIAQVVSETRLVYSTVVGNLARARKNGQVVKTSKSIPSVYRKV